MHVCYNVIHVIMYVSNIIFMSRNIHLQFVYIRKFCEKRTTSREERG